MVTMPPRVMQYLRVIGALFEAPWQDHAKFEAVLAGIWETMSEGDRKWVQVTVRPLLPQLMGIDPRQIAAAAEIRAQNIGAVRTHDENSVTRPITGRP